MKRLLICTPSANLHGGVERIIESLARLLPSRGFEVVFGLAKGARFNDPRRFRAAYPDIAAVEIDGTSGTAFGRRRAMRHVIERVDPDIVLIARLFDAYPAAAELKRAGHRLRLAVTIQVYEPEYIVDAFRYRQLIDLCEVSGNLIARACAEVAGIPADRIARIAGGVAPPRHVRVPSDVLRLGYVGRLETTQKRALDLADALAAIRDRGVPFRCVIAGAGSVEDELRRRVRDAGLASSVEFLGWLGTEELYDRVYPNLDVLLHFAQFEGIPIAPREAMAHGVVPVMARFTGIEEEGHFAEGVDSLLFDVGDIAAAADHVTQLHRDRELLQRLSAAARASQTGIRSEQGAADGWARALDDALAREQRIGELPPLRTAHGRLDRLLPAPLAENVRRALGRRFEHSDAGSEWPHWSGEPIPEVLDRLRALAQR